MARPFEGVHILEVANWTFVPQVGAVFADLGAEVVKVEHPVRGDPQRSLISSGMSPTTTRNVNYATEQTNHGKRSIGLDIAGAEGHELLMRLAERADVFLTNFLPAARTKLGIDVEDVRRRNPRIIYARGSGQGQCGPDADKAGYDGTAFWGRGGVGWLHTVEGADAPVAQRGAFGDRAGAMNLAFGIASALYRRQQTNEPSVVDVSLMSTAMWMLSSDLVPSKLVGRDPARARDRRAISNPISNQYQTKDCRWISLVMMESDRFWPDLCEHLGRPELADDPRFVDAAARATHAAACVDELDAVFATATLEQWRERLRTVKGAWAPHQSPLEVMGDPQVEANQFTTDLIGDDGEPFSLIAAPVQFDGSSGSSTRAPEFGQHTEELLMELGMDWDEIMELKQRGTVN